MQNAASGINLYLFNTFGSEYTIGASYVVDEEGKICADLGANTIPQDASVQTLVQIPYRRMQGAIKLCAMPTQWRLKYYSAKPPGSKRQANSIK